MNIVSFKYYMLLNKKMNTEIWKALNISPLLLTQMIENSHSNKSIVLWNTIGKV